MKLRVCIPTAGTGSRLGDATRYLNKSLVSVDNRPTLSHQIEKFPLDTEFVIALGHKGELVREFLALAYPERTFYFAEVHPFEGDGSGLGLSLLACEDLLQQPFIFISCDTLVTEPIPFPECNWMGCSARDDLSQYRTVMIEGGRVQDIREKGKAEPGRSMAYIGMAGILDYSAFWQAMHAGGELAISTGEAFGLGSLLADGIKACQFTWYDTGNPSALAQAREAFLQAGAPNILPKGNEAIWFVGDRVIKYSDDMQFVANRVKRVQHIADFVPRLTGQSPHMYRYEKVQGHVFSEIVSVPKFKKLLAQCEIFWQPQVPEPSQSASFIQACRKFYEQKTRERVDLFYSTFRTNDNSLPINDCPQTSLESVLSALDWEWLANGLPGRFHGDFHFENILWNSHDEKITFLDWRQDFGGSLSVGDIYYDLAKLLHGLIVSHELIAHDQYKVEWTDQEIRFDFHRKHLLVECEQYFYLWLQQKGYDVRKVRVLTALIYLNIAALHHAPYSYMLYALGKSMLSELVS